MAQYSLFMLKVPLNTNQPFVASVTKLGKRAVLKFWCKSAKVIYGARTRNGQLLGPGNQRSRTRGNEEVEKIPFDQISQELSGKCSNVVSQLDAKGQRPRTHEAKDRFGYNGAQRYEQFLQVGWLYRALILLGLALCLPSASVSSVLMVLYRYKFFLLTSFSLPFSELSLVGLALDAVD